jgi:hypothetical protein
MHGPSNLDILPIEIGLLLEVQVKIVLLGIVIPFPGGA